MSDSISLVSITPVSIVIPFRRLESGVEIWMQVRESSDDLQGLLEFPGGKIESDEIPAAAAQRELAEETGFDVQELDLNLLKIYSHSYGDKTVNIYAFLLDVTDRDDTDKDGLAPNGWYVLDTKWRDSYGKQIPQANVNIFEDLTRELCDK